jgi:uncharacterized membrane protein HdeD (DUF308 family)
MNVNRIRAIIAIVVIGVFMLITAIMAIYPLFAETKVELNTYSDFFAKIASVYTGIIGVIVGYYFGRSKELIDSKKTTSKSD